MGFVLEILDFLKLLLASELSENGPLLKTTTGN